MKWNEAKSLIEDALAIFMERDRPLLVMDANERSVSYRLAMHLQRRFGDGWDVDCEYNRMLPDDQGRVSKRLLKLPQTAPTDDTQGKTVFPDVIIHRRGPDGPNLLAIEIKKSGRDDAEDRLELSAYVEELKYEHGALLVFRTGDQARFDQIERFPSN